MPAQEVLRTAMIEGAQAFGLKTRLRKSGLDDRGHLGDRIEDDLVPNLVYAASGHEVKTAMVAGRVLTADEATVRAEAQAETVTHHVGADPVHKGMALLAAMEADRL